MTNEKACSQCGLVKPLTEFYRRLKSECKDCRRARQREYLQQVGVRERRREYQQQPRTRELRRKRNRKLRSKLRTEALNAYGNRCAGCGTTENLEFHHVAFDGGAHREEIGAGGSDTLHLWLKRNGFPPIVELLCKDCHKRNHAGQRQRRGSRTLRETG